MLSAGVVADANVLLSAALGKAAARVVLELALPVHVTRFNAEEVAQYLPRLSEKYRLPLPLVELQWLLLPKQIHPVELYAACFDEACRDLARRDPDDAHPLALARALGLPLWSNDHDLRGHGVEVFTTAQLLARLERTTP